LTGEERGGDVAAVSDLRFGVARGVWIVETIEAFGRMAGYLA
jgi:hypothetical protein